MTNRSINLIGLSKAELETPCLCLDLSRFEANVDSLISAASTAEKGWRPRGQCHNSADIARQLVDRGAIGITCAKVSEAELFASAGIRDLLITDLPVGQQRVKRLAALCQIANPIVVCDHYVQAEALSAECHRTGVVCRALVEINIGLERTGVRPGRDARELGYGINRLPGLQLVGITGDEHHVATFTDVAAKREAADAAFGILAHARDLYRKNGLCCDIVTAGGSHSLPYAFQSEALTEVQAGGAIFGDPEYSRLGDLEGLVPALSVLTTVISRPSFNRAVLDAGRKSIAAEYHPPIPAGLDDATVVAHTSDHIVLELGPQSLELRIGDQVELIVGDSNLTIMLHDEFLCFRGDRLEAVWPIGQRGEGFSTGKTGIS